LKNIYKQQCKKSSKKNQPVDIGFVV